MKIFLANYMVGKGNQYDLIHISLEYDESFVLCEGKLRMHGDLDVYKTEYGVTSKGLYWKRVIYVNTWYFCNCSAHIM